MHCQSRRSTRLPADSPRLRPRDPGSRIGDADRDRVAALLGDAAAEGYLRMEELDERLSAALSATTGADLSAVEADLPEEFLDLRARREAFDRARADARTGLVRHLTAYLGVMLLLVAVWLSVGVTGGGWYPWPIWPALGWGIGVVGHIRTALAAPSGPVASPGARGDVTDAGVGSRRWPPAPPGH